MTARKLHLENPWEIWAADLNCFFAENKAPFQPGGVLGVWEVRKWLSRSCSRWKHSIVTDSEYHQVNAFLFQHISTKSLSDTCKTPAQSIHRLAQHFQGLAETVFIFLYLISRPSFVIHPPLCWMCRLCFMASVTVSRWYKVNSVKEGEYQRRWVDPALCVSEDDKRNCWSKNNLICAEVNAVACFCIQALLKRFSSAHQLVNCLSVLWLCSNIRHCPCRGG